MSEHITEEEDIRINVANLYFSLQHTPELASSIEKLSTEITRAQDTISGIGDIDEYTSVSELANDSALTTKCYDKTNTIINKLVNTKNLLISFNTDAMHFFKFTDAGYLKADEEGNFSYVMAPEFGQEFYGSTDYAGTNISERGCGLCTVCSAACFLTNSFYGPGITSTYVTSTRPSTAIEKAASALGLEFYRETISGLSREENIPEGVVTRDMTEEEAIASLIANGYSVGIVYNIDPVNGNDHFMCIPASAGDGNYFVVDSYTNKGEYVSGVRTGVYSLDNIVRGDFNNQDNPVGSHSTLYVFKPTEAVGDAKVSSNTVYITNELYNQIINTSDSEIIETPSTDLSNAYTKSVEEYEGIIKT